MSAHDVRNLRVCQFCGSLGLSLVKYGVRHYAHATCLVKAKGEEYAINLPLGAIVHLTLDSLSKKGMQYVLDRLDRDRREHDRGKEKADG